MATSAYLLDTDERVAHEWKKWTAMSGQANVPVEQRTGRLMLLNADAVRAAGRPF